MNLLRQNEINRQNQYQGGRKNDKQSEFRVPLKNGGYNGDLTSAQNGSVGGEMVRQMIKRQEESMAGK